MEFGRVVLFLVRPFSLRDLNWRTSIIINEHGSFWALTFILSLAQSFGDIMLNLASLSAMFSAEETSLDVPLHHAMCSLCRLHATYDVSHLVCVKNLINQAPELEISEVISYGTNWRLSNLHCKICSCVGIPRWNFNYCTCFEWKKLSPWLYPLIAVTLHHN